MRRIDSRLLVGLLLIVGGIVYLLQNLNLITWGPTVWTGAFFVGAIVFLVAYLRDRASWWAIIPGMTLLGLGAISTLDRVAPAFEAAWGGTIFLGAIGLSFLLIYLRDRSLWWAIIPGGVLATLAAVAGLDQLALPIETGGLFFIGMGLTFLLVAFLPNPSGPMRWAFIPAGALIIMGILIAVGFERAIGYLWPLALIAVGLVLLFRAMRRPA